MNRLFLISFLFVCCLTSTKNSQVEIFKEKVLYHIQGDWKMEEQSIRYRDCTNSDSEWVETFQYILNIKGNGFSFSSYPTDGTGGDTINIEGEFTILNSIESSLRNTIDTTLYTLLFHDHNGFNGLDCEKTFGFLYYGNEDPSEIVLRERQKACVSFSRKVDYNCGSNEQELMFEKNNVY